MYSVPTHGILQYIFEKSAASIQKSIFHQAALSITNVVQQNPRHKAELLCFGDYCFN
jgi:hypothetical protein